MKFGLATIIPWSLVLILGTLYISNGTVPMDGHQVVDNNVVEPESPEEIKKRAVAKALSKVHEEFNKIESKEDRSLIYKLLSGSAEYLKHAVSLENTGQFDPILGRVQSSYGWNRESYPDFTQAVSDYLIEVGYDEPRKLDSEESRGWFQGIFESLAEVTK